MSGSTEWISGQPGRFGLMDRFGQAHVWTDGRLEPAGYFVSHEQVKMVPEAGNPPESSQNQPLYLFEDPNRNVPDAYLAYGRPPEVPQIDGLANAARVFSLLGFLGFAFGPIGLILGYIALGRLREDDVASRKVARNAIIFGWIFTVIFLILVIAIVTQH